MKSLVAYFSTSGVTKNIAMMLAHVVEAEVFEISPQEPYTRADLDWTNSRSRSSVEMKNPQSRPAIKNKIENIDQYDVIFLGFPIWWYVAPTIINTFLESYDLSNKKIILFATSGGSNFGKTISQLENSTKGTIVEGKILNGADEKEIAEWVSTLACKVII